MKHEIYEPLGNNLVVSLEKQDPYKEYSTKPLVSTLGLSKTLDSLLENDSDDTRIEVAELEEKASSYTPIGKVIALGDDVKDISIGDRIVVDFNDYPKIVKDGYCHIIIEETDIAVIIGDES